jgi:hypothetical protein
VSAACLLLALPLLAGYWSRGRLAACLPPAAPLLWLALNHLLTLRHATAVDPLQVEDFASWLGGKQEEQGKLAAHQDPAFKTQEVTSWLGRVQKVRRQWQLLGIVAAGLSNTRCCSCNVVLLASICRCHSAPPHPGTLFHSVGL